MTSGGDEMRDEDGSRQELLTSAATWFTDLTYVAQILPRVRLIAFLWAEGAPGRTQPDPGSTGASDNLGALLPPLLLDSVRATAAGDDTARHDLVVAHHGSDGDERWFQHRWRCDIQPDSSVLVIGAARDVTAEVEANSALLTSERVYRQMAENSADFAMRTTPERVIEFVSESITEVLGWQPSELVGHRTSEFIHPDDLALAKEHSDRVNAGEVVYLRCRFRAADGNYRWMAQHVRPIVHSSGEVERRTGVWRDISGEMQALAALEASEETFRTAMESAPTGIALLDADRNFIAVNAALCDILRQDRDWLLTHSIADVVHPDDDATEQSLHLRGDSHEPNASAELRCIRGDGAVIWVHEAIGVPRAQERGRVAYVAHFIDITDDRVARQRLHFLAEHDDLTGQLRPGALLAHLHDLLARPRLDDRVVAALFVDVDYLKLINDTYGHGCGDAVIRTIARRIAATVRGTDLVARIGGDEFVVVLPQARIAQDVVLVGDKIQLACREPVVADGHSISVTLSMGGCLADPGDDPESLLQRADRALYRSKRLGRNCLSMYDPAVDLPLAGGVAEAGEEERGPR